ncbi:4'-phosphopantetheinyl transferase superfamily protein [Streptomyces sp. NPDC040724]|uniref:4'-phosphopantetheinyl transferase family protein n=1 Tax=unclassified Streptomyces TaxID=2593676 RepID=UPI0033F9EACB
MIEELLPPGVTSSEAFDDAAPAPLFPAEAALMQGRRDRRRRQFATARACARRCLADLGRPAAALLPGPGGAPQWPAGVVGSITHCAGYRAAAAAPASAMAAIGIDAEPAGPLPRGVLALIASDTERTHLADLAAADPSTPWDRIFFSAKEAAYKAWYPATGIWLGFRDATLTLFPDGRFTTTLHPPLPPPVDPHYRGRWLAGPHLVLTAVAREHRRPPQEAAAPVPASAAAPV